MRGLAADRDLCPGEPGDALDGADDEVRVLQHRSLLDMQFQIRVGHEPTRLGVAGIADTAQFVADRGAVDAADRVGVIEREATDMNRLPIA